MVWEHLGQSSRPLLCGAFRSLGTPHQLVVLLLRWQGFQRQTARWPVQPLQAAAAYLRAAPARCVVADFGCGDAQLAALAPQETVHSLDLVAAHPGIIACDMAHTPLGASHAGCSSDVAFRPCRASSLCGCTSARLLRRASSLGACVGAPGAGSTHLFPSSWQLNAMVLPQARITVIIP